MQDTQIQLIDGPIGASLIVDAIQAFQSSTHTGAIAQFMGQVRADLLPQGIVQSIEYMCYAEMAKERLQTIVHQTRTNYSLTGVIVYHSLGVVPVGQVCLFVCTSAMHRRQALEACTALTERIKKEVPIWGKEVLQDSTYVWKENM